MNVQHSVAKRRNHSRRNEVPKRQNHSQIERFWRVSNGVGQLPAGHFQVQIGWELMHGDTKLLGLRSGGTYHVTEQRRVGWSPE